MLAYFQSPVLIYEYRINNRVKAKVIIDEGHSPSGSYSSQVRYTTSTVLSIEAGCLLRGIWLGEVLRKLAHRGSIPRSLLQFVGVFGLVEGLKTLEAREEVFGRMSRHCSEELGVMDGLSALPAVWRPGLFWEMPLFIYRQWFETVKGPYIGTRTAPFVKQIASHSSWAMRLVQSKNKPSAYVHSNWNSSSTSRGVNSTL